VYADSGCFCNNGSWKNRQLKIVETEFDEICEKGKDYIIFYGNQKYTCNDGDIFSILIFSSDYDNVFGKCEGENQGKDTVYYGLKFACDTTVQNSWYRYEEADSLAGTYCQKAIEGLEVILRDSTHVICNGEGTWLSQAFWEYMSECNEGSEGLIESNGVTRSVCRSGRWTPADTFHVTDERDGKEYAAITINGYTWMAEPLRYVPKGKTVYVERSPYPVKEVEGDELVYYPWVVAMNLDEKYERSFANGYVINSSTVVQGICMDGWHIPRFEEIRPTLTTKIYSRFGNLSKAYDDDDIVGIHFVKRKQLIIERDTVAGVDSVSAVGNMGVDYIWTADETKNSRVTDPDRADEARFDTYLKDGSRIKYGAAPVRCVKDYE
jgi:uncharacterized protein (TIGR02145 family)